MNTNCFLAISFPSIELHRKYFPSDVLKWIKANASANTAVKLMNVCKYFQCKSISVVPVVDIDWFGRGEINIWRKNFNREKYIIKRIAKPMWINNNLTLRRWSSVYGTISSKISTKIIVFGLKRLYIEDRKILFNDFKFLTSGGNIKYISMSKAAVEDSYGNKVTLQKILECLPKLEIWISRRMPCLLSDITFDVSLTLKSISLLDVERSLNFKEFTDFMLKNQNVKISFSYYFYVSEDRVKDSIDKIVKEWSLEYEPPKLDWHLPFADSTTAMVNLRNQCSSPPRSPPQNENQNKKWISYCCAMCCIM